MDTPSTGEPSNAPLSPESAVDAFASALEPVKAPEKTPEALEAEKLEDEARKAAESDDGEPNTQEEGDDAAGEKVTIEVDGKTVELSKAELADFYKNGLRQADYTKKTMEVADARKAAEAETAKARQERQVYAQGLQKNALQLEAVIEQQQKIDWEKLIEADPVEALRQQHLLQRRQAAWQETHQQLQLIAEQSQAEQVQHMQSYRAEQQEKLIAKLPDWKDPVKAKAGSAELSEYLKSQGFEDAELKATFDHRAVVLGHKAMKYDQMMEKARAAAKKVQALPQKVVRPGVGDTPNLDRRSSAMKQLSKTGRVEDAVALFDQFV
jgi:hypothetical protein